MLTVFCDLLADAASIDALNCGADEAVDGASDEPCYHRRANYDAQRPARVTGHSKKPSGHPDDQGSGQRRDLRRSGLPDRKSPLPLFRSTADTRWT